MAELRQPTVRLSAHPITTYFTAECWPTTDQSGCHETEPRNKQIILPLIGFCKGQVLCVAVVDSECNPCMAGRFLDWQLWQGRRSINMVAPPHSCALLTPRSLALLTSLLLIHSTVASWCPPDKTPAQCFAEETESKSKAHAAN